MQYGIYTHALITYTYTCHHPSSQGWVSIYNVHVGWWVILLYLLPFYSCTLYMYMYLLSYM